MYHGAFETAFETEGDGDTDDDNVCTMEQLQCTMEHDYSTAVVDNALYCSRGSQQLHE